MSSKQNILLLTDSLGNPREEPEIVKADETWCDQIKRFFPEKTIYSINIRGMDTQNLIQEVEYIKNCFDPKIIILQVGIVDCTPRTMRKIEVAILKRMPLFISNHVRSFLKRYRNAITKFRKITYVNKIKFGENLTYFKNELCEAEIYAIPIMPPTENFIKKNKLIEKNIHMYNKILQEVFQDKFLESCYFNVDVNKISMSDDHHLNKKGHVHLFTIINKILN